ncbi:hypothetical protein JKP88DRAFT_286547 [Tribonema minus]|uniref:TRUD domain-containing protein n=1 Tax=Tribonema minus TaxID=303371 RepID=A0A836CLL9_9STRA|nr:hypothetical protein JKP88DRAFT_286547 [Tribonema minus]
MAAACTCNALVCSTSAEVPALEGASLKNTAQDFVVVELPADGAAAYTPADPSRVLDSSVSKPVVQLLPPRHAIAQAVQEWRWQRQWLSGRLGGGRDAGEAEMAAEALEGMGKGFNVLEGHLGAAQVHLLQDWLLELAAAVDPLTGEFLEGLGGGKGGAGPAARLLLTCPADMDKAGRTGLHSLFKSLFGYLETKTVLGQPQESAPAEAAAEEDADASTPVATPAAALELQYKPPSKGRRGWPRGRPEYLEFSLYKAGRGTHEAIDALSRVLRVKRTRFSYAGSKDRRAFTAQKVRCWRLEAEELVAADAAMQKEGLAVSDLCYKPSELGLGQLRGNRFTVGVSLPEGSTLADAQLSAAADKLVAQGFVNFFGPQRFGRADTPNHEVGMSILRLEWAEAVDKLLAPSSRDGADVAAAKAAWADTKAAWAETKLCVDSAEVAKAKAAWAQTKDVAAALALLPRRAMVEHALLGALAKSAGKDPLSALSALDEPGGKDSLSTLRALPRNLRQLYTQAYQSLLWNCAASTRMEMNTAKAVLGDLTIHVLGDLVLLDARTQAPLTAWDFRGGGEEPAGALSDATAPAQEPARPAGVKGQGLGRWKKKTQGGGAGQGGRGGIPPSTFVAPPSIRVYMVEDEDAEQGRFGIEHVVEHPAHVVGTRTLHRLYADGVHETVLDGHPQSDFTLMGAYRHLIVKPEEIAAAATPSTAAAAEDADAYQDDAATSSIRDADTNCPGGGDSGAGSVTLSFSLPPSSFCGRTHAAEAVERGIIPALAPPHGHCHECKLPGCSATVFFESDTGRVYDYCCRAHAYQAGALSGRSGSGSGGGGGGYAAHGPQCALPGCARAAYVDPTSNHAHDYCGRTHAREHAQMLSDGGGAAAATAAAAAAAAAPAAAAAVAAAAAAAAAAVAAPAPAPAAAAAPSPAAAAAAAAAPSPATPAAAAAAAAAPRDCSLPGCAKPRWLDPRAGLGPILDAGVERVFVTSRPNAVGSADTGFQLSVLTRTHADFAPVREQFLSKWTKPGAPPSVVRVFKVKVPDHMFSVVSVFEVKVPDHVFRAYDAYKQLKGNRVRRFHSLAYDAYKQLKGNRVRRRFHGTSCSADCNFFVNFKDGPCGGHNCAVCGICTHGFLMEYSGATAQRTKFNLRYGRGLYFSSISGKTEEPTLGGTLPPTGHDSIVANPSPGNLYYDELVVYCNEAAIPTFMIAYTLPC